MNLPEDLAEVGYITGAYGLLGWVRIKPYSADAGALLNAKTWWLDKPDLHDVDVLQVKMHVSDILAKLMGVADRDAAEKLQGAKVQIRRSHFPVLPENEYYWSDLIGLQIDNLQGHHLGQVNDLIDNGAHPILRVLSSDGIERLIPFVDHFVKSVDQRAKKIIVDWGPDY